MKTNERMKKFIRKNRSVGKVVVDEEELIQQVSTRPILYNRSLEGNRKAPMRQQKWDEVSEAMDATVEECKKRWRALRDSFGKHHKRMQRSAEENVISKQRKWVFYDKMSFLIPHLDCASYELNDNILDEFGDNSEDAQSIECEPPVLTTDEQAMDKVLETNHEEAERHKSMDDHNEEMQQSNVVVEASHSMPVQKELVVMENNVHYNPSHQQHMMRSDGTRCSNNTTNSLQCNESCSDFGHVYGSEEKFLLSCAPALYRFTNHQRALARLKIQQILYDIEFGQQQSN